MKTILFDMVQAIGHMNASFEIAGKLQAAGNRVVYIGGKQFSSVVLNKGFEYIIANNSLILSDNNEFKLKGFVFYIECFISLFTKARQQMFYKSVSDFEILIKQIAPDFIILDIQLSMKAIIYHHLKIPYACIETMPLSLYDPWIPPFTSTIIPAKTPFSKVCISFAWQKIVWQRKLRHKMFALLLSGQDYYSLFRKLAKEFRFPYREKLNLKSSFVVNFKDIIILSMTSPCFDFPRKYQPKCYYAESRVDLDREKEIANKRYLMIMEKIQSQKKHNPDIRLIYCSLGTVTQGFNKPLGVFFRKIKKISERNPGYIFILSVGMDYDASCLLPVPHNMYIFQRIPQLHMLSQSDMMITHGGMNSIAECIRMQVPMLVCPLSRYWDQPGNSARVVYHEIGLRANIRRNSHKQIERKIIKIISEHARYKQNLSHMNKKMVVENKITHSWWNLFQFNNK